MAPSAEIRFPFRDTAESPFEPARAGNVIGQLAAPAQSRRPEAGCFGRVRACSLAPKAQPVAPGEERVIHLSRPPDGGKKGVFGAFWGFGQKALRREEESTLCFPACRKTGWQIASCTNAA